MKTNKKVILIAGISTIVLAVIAIVIFLCIQRASMHGTCGANLTWVYDGKGTLTISGQGEMEDYVIIGEERKYAEWWVYNSEIKTVVVENGVTSIGNCAFNECAAAEVILPETVTNIGAKAFSKCENLKEITIPVGVDIIESNTFYYCISLEKISIPESVKKIGDGAFCGCCSLTDIILPDKLSIICMQAFYECTGLTEITIPQNVKKIEWLAFSGCDSLEEIIFLGDMPFELRIDDDGTYVSLDIFAEVMATAYYPENNKTWDDFTPLSLYGYIKWVPYS